MDGTDSVAARLALRSVSEMLRILRHPVRVHAGSGASASPSSVAGTLKPEHPWEPPAALFVQLMAP